MNTKIELYRSTHRVGQNAFRRVCDASGHISSIHFSSAFTLCAEFLKKLQQSDNVAYADRTSFMLFDALMTRTLFYVKNWANMFSLSPHPLLRTFHFIQRLSVSAVPCKEFISFNS